MYQIYSVSTFHTNRWQTFVIIRLATVQCKHHVLNAGSRMRV